MEGARLDAQAKRDAIVPLKRQLAAIEDELANVEAVHRVTIAEELDDKQKPKYSNEATRKAELARRCREDPEYQQIQDRVKAAEQRVQQAETEAKLVEAQLANLVDAHRTQLALLANSTAVLEAATNLKGV